MAVPDYQTLMSPIVELASDSQDHRIADLIERLSEKFALTEEERDQRIQSGQRTIFNRTHWAVTYLVKAGVLERSARGTVRITARGREVLADKPKRIDEPPGVRTQLPVSSSATEINRLPGLPASPVDVYE